MRASDLDRYNELTIHQEIAAKKVCSTALALMPDTQWSVRTYMYVATQLWSRTW